MWANIASLTSEKVPLTILLKGGKQKNDEHEATKANEMLKSDQSEKVGRSQDCIALQHQLLLRWCTV